MRNLMRSSVMLTLILVLSGCAGESRLNVIMISLDTLRADHLGCYGYDRPTSPFLDRIAEQGVLFETAIVQLPGTLPSHMSIFTGLYPNEHGVFPPNGALASNIPTLPEVLHEAGYRTAGFTEGGYMAGHFGFNRGFEEFNDEGPKLTNDIEITFSRGLEFLQGTSRSEPFFLFLHTYAIHDPYFPPLPYTTLYLDGLATPASFQDRFDFFNHTELPLMTPHRTEEHRQIYQATRDLITRNLPPGADLPTGPLLAAKNRGEPRSLTPETLAYYTSLYDASINYVDDVMAAFFGSLEKMGLLDDTLIIITSDHGEEFLEHGKLTHEQVYHECLHVPLIILSPGTEKGRRVPEIVRSIDLAPTILDLTKVAPPAKMSGLSLVPLLGGSQPWEAQEAFARDAGNTGKSLHVFDQRLLQTVVHQSNGKADSGWFTRTARFTTNRPAFTFRGKSYHSPREIEILVDGTRHSTLSMTPEWAEFNLSFDGDVAGREILMRTAGCDVPEVIEGNGDLRCLSFRIADFPQDNLELFDLNADPEGTTNIVSTEIDLGRKMARRIEDYQVKPLTEGETVALSPEDIEHLKSLGYLQ